MKRVSTTYVCDLCSCDLAGETPRDRIHLAHGAGCDLCAGCAKAYQPLVEKLAALVIAAMPENPYDRFSQQQAPTRPWGF